MPFASKYSSNTSEPEIVGFEMNLNVTIEEIVVDTKKVVGSSAPLAKRRKALVINKDKVGNILVENQRW